MSARERRELAALAKMPDSAIDTSDIPEITDWSKAQVGRFYRPIKQPVTIRLDADVIAWFKRDCAAIPDGGKQGAAGIT